MACYNKIMFDLFKDELDGSTFDCPEDFNAEVMRASAELGDELGKMERMILKADKDLLDDLGITIKGVNDGEE